jgi:peptide/nickel transport system substrate-binding protein
VTIHDDGRLGGRSTTSDGHDLRTRRRSPLPRRPGREEAADELLEPREVAPAVEEDAAASERNLFTRRVLAQHGLQGLLTFSAMGLLSACGGANGGGQSASTVAVAGGGKEIANLDWIMLDDASTMDAALAVDGGSLAIVPNMFDSLFTFASDGTMRPALATGHSTPDPRTILLEIREGVRFHDGSPLSAEDVAFSLSRYLNKTLASYWAQYFRNVASFEATGAHEVTIKLAKPDADVLPALGSIPGYVASKAFIERHGRKAGTAGVGIVATGPYRFVSWHHGQRIVIERFEDYWDKDHAALKVARFTGHVLSDPTTQIQSLRAGEMDGMDAGGLTGRQLRQLVQGGEVRATSVNRAGVVSLFLNVAKPPFDDVRVRQAMAYAIDRRTLLQTVQGGTAKLSKSVAPPASWGFERQQFQAAYDALEGYDHDLDKAKALVAAAGAQGASGELWALSTYKELAEALLSAGNDAGLDLKLRIVDLAQFTQEAASPRRAYAGILSQYSAIFPDPAVLLRDLCASDALGNACGYRNPRVDANFALENSLPTEPARRAQLLIEAQRSIVADSPIIPLWTVESAIALRKEIGGFVPNPFEFGYVKDLSGQ